MLEHICAHAGDPILGLNEDVLRGREGPRLGKINLNIGMYFDDSGTVPLMRAVAQAEGELHSRADALAYLPMAGRRTANTS